MAMDGSAAVSFTSTDIRAVIKFFTFEEMLAKGAYNRLVTVLHDNAPSYETIRQWIRKFENRRQSAEVLGRSGRSTPATLDEFAGKLRVRGGDYI